MKEQREVIEPIDLLLFCPNCAEQHVDEAKPDVCEVCGGEKDDFPRNEGAIICSCPTFTAWLNPPHKSHRCAFCNHVFRPADVPTNGVLAIKTKGERDGNPRPRYFATTKDWEDSHAALVAALDKIHSWLVCAAIASPDDMAQSFEEMELAARQALAKVEGGKNDA